MPNSSEFEQDVEMIVEELQESLDALPEADVPFNAVRLTKEEQVERYLEMRDDREAWRQLLAERPLESVLKYASDMEAKLAEESDNAE